LRGEKEDKRGVTGIKATYIHSITNRYRGNTKKKEKRRKYKLDS